MKRSPLRRRTPLRRASWFDEVIALPDSVKQPGLTRKTRLKPRRAKPRRTEKVRDRAYLDKIKALGYCAASELPFAGKCDGPIDPDHFGERGMGQKTHDSSSYPICRKHHDCRHALSGPFRYWDRERLRTWCAEQIGKAAAALTLAEIYSTLKGHGARRAS